MAAKYAQNWQVHRQHSEPHSGLPDQDESQPRKRKSQ
jgi:hypothetical protein